MPGFPPETPPPEQRFIRFRQPDSPSGVVTTTFLAADERPDGETHPVVVHLAQQEPERAARVAQGLDHLLDREEEVLAWLEADPSHTALFAGDPAGALHMALPDLPEDFFDGWRPEES